MSLKAVNKVDTNRYELEIEVGPESFEFQRENFPYSSKPDYETATFPKSEFRLFYRLGDSSLGGRDSIHYLKIFSFKIIDESMNPVLDVFRNISAKEYGFRVRRQKNIGKKSLFFSERRAKRLSVGGKRQGEQRVIGSRKSAFKSFGRFEKVVFIAFLKAENIYVKTFFKKKFSRGESSKISSEKREFFSFHMLKSLRKINKPPGLKPSAVR